MTLPAVKEYRLFGPGPQRAAGGGLPGKGRLEAPKGATFTDDADAVAVVLGAADAQDFRAVARALPAPTDLASGTLVVVLGAIVEAPSLASRFRSALGRTRTIPRADRCTALLARGYVRLGAADDLAWGYVPQVRDDAR